MKTPDVVHRTRRTNFRDDLGVGAVLVIIWMLLWGEASAANAASGVLVATLLLVSFPVDHDVIAVRHRLRPVAAGRLAVFFLTDLFRSTLATAVDVVRPRSRVRTGIIACPLRVDNDGLVTFLANLIAVSPGTMPIEVGYRPHVIFVHSLRGVDPDEVRAFVARLEELAVMALGGPQAIGAVVEPAPWPPPPPGPQPTVDRPS
jgi:multicomponent Na+:H+ antiporter subunit E